MTSTSTSHPAASFIVPSRSTSLSTSSSRSTTPLLRTYLITYNLISALGWLYVWLQILHHITTSSAPVSTLYPAVRFSLQLTQTLAVLEIAHSLLGLVRSPLLTAALQVSSRLFVVWGLLYVAPPSRYQVGFLLCALSWATVEVPRYLFYAVALLSPSSVPWLLTWLRYSLFLVLYPTGITGEVLCLLSALSWLRRHDHVLSVAMPNALNFEFSYVIFCYVILASYLPGGPFMIRMMWQQRKKVLGGSAVDAKKEL